MVEKIKNLKQKILTYIKNGEVSMKPRWFFVLKSLLKVVLFCLIFLIVLYFISFIMLVMKEKNFFLLFDVGPGKIHYLFDSLPWLIVAFALVGILTLEVLVRQFSFTYQAPVFYSFIVIVFLVLATSFVLNQFDKRFVFPRFGEEPQFFLMGDMHKYYRGEIEDRPYKPMKYKKNKENLKMEFE